MKFLWFCEILIELRALEETSETRKKVQVETATAWLDIYGFLGNESNLSLK